MATTSKNLKTLKLTPTVGAEVLDVDCDRMRTDPDLPHAVMQALEENGVLIFRRLHIDDDTQVEFCGKLGELALIGQEENPAIFVVTLDTNKNPVAEYLKATIGWHIDGTVERIPPKATMLSAKVLSATGGDTEFASTYAAYDQLSAEEKERFAKLRVHHSQEASLRDGEPNVAPDQLAAWKQKSCEHPLVWTHQTGRKSLVIGHSVEYVVGMELDEGHALLADLNERATRPEWVYRHRWSEGDTVFWDNRGVVHRATPYDAGSGREMHRTTLIGDEPIQ